jgi:hypothetical protein
MNESNPQKTDLPNAVAWTPRRSRLWARFLLWLIIFVSGGAAGAGVTLIVIRQRVLHAIQHLDEMPARIAGCLRQRYDLSDRQTQQVEEILVRRQHALRVIRRQFQPEVERELDRLQEDISAVLDDKQRTKWQEYFQKLRQTWTPPLELQRQPPLEVGK